MGRLLLEAVGLSPAGDPLRSHTEHFLELSYQEMRTLGYLHTANWPSLVRATLGEIQTQALPVSTLPKLSTLLQHRELRKGDAFTLR
jgi:hypothetical protein